MTILRVDVGRTTRSRVGTAGRGARDDSERVPVRTTIAQKERECERERTKKNGNFKTGVAFRRRVIRV